MVASSRASTMRLSNQNTSRDTGTFNRTSPIASCRQTPISTTIGLILLRFSLSPAAINKNTAIPATLWKIMADIPSRRDYLLHPLLPEPQRDVHAILRPGT